jgi:hypothetical protein
MLHPKNNRIDYGEQLIPPEGYDLAYAVGSTYSLDLEALMILPVALFYAQKLDGNPDDLRYDMLDAITKAADKITVYYQSGQLKVPKKYHHLMAYWEKGIQSFTMPNHVSSFHPKVWVIRYESKDKFPSKYRVLVTSRNLTFARDWDVAFSTDGEVSMQEQPNNLPLVHFLQHLNSVGKKNIPTAFINDLMKVKFDIPDKFDTLEFMPIGIKNPKTTKIYTNPITAENALWNEMLIVSPFVDKPTLDKLHHNTRQKPFLLSRKDELDGIPNETLQLFDTWQFNQFFEKAEFLQELEEDGIEPFSQNLHAKLFVAMADKIPHWYLGSANCSDPAQGRNIEFMVELKGSKGAGLKTKDIFNELSDSNKTDGITLFTRYDKENKASVEEQKNIDAAIRKIKYDLTLMPIKGKAMIIEGGTAYNLNLEIDARKLKLPSGFSVSIKPLPEQNKAGVYLVDQSINNIDKFTGYAETELSIFLVVEIYNEDISYSHFLLPMEIELPDSRLNKIFTSIISSRDKFYKYLAFLLTGEETNLIGNSGSLKDNSLLNAEGLFSLGGIPIYEKLLIATSRYPEKLKSIDLLIQRLKNESADLEEPIISNEFESFWQIFQTFIKAK